MESRSRKCWYTCDDAIDSIPRNHQRHRNISHASFLSQALAQAKIATLPPQYGLYTAFTGLLVYVFFATSKDVTIGPTAVLSLFTSQAIATFNFDASGNQIYDPVTFAVALALMSGIYLFFIGLFRLGLIVDFIPSTVISGFTTGSAISIIIGQIPALLGISGINTNYQASYLIVRDIFANIRKTKQDAIIGFICILILASLKFSKERWGKRSRVIYYLGVARNGIALVIFTLASYLVTRFRYNGNPPFNLVGNIPKGFQHAQVPTFDSKLVSLVAVPAISVALIAMVEHVAIAKSFGRQNGYSINASQEITAIGLTNIIGSFIGAYPATGSFSRSSVKVKKKFNEK